MSSPRIPFDAPVSRSNVCIWGAFELFLFTLFNEMTYWCINHTRSESDTENVGFFARQCSRFQSKDERPNRASRLSAYLQKLFIAALLALYAPIPPIPPSADPDEMKIILELEPLVLRIGRDSWTQYNNEKKFRSK